MGTSLESNPANRPGNAAIFLDRDGTLIEDVDYLSEPKDIRVIPGVTEGLMRLSRAGFVHVIVTNQSAIGRGMITLKQLDRIHDEMCRIFSDQGITFGGIYSCPQAPISDSETEVEHEDRKPGPGMLKRASRDLGLDLTASWMIGDKMSDVLAGHNAGCRSIRVRTGKGRIITPEEAKAAKYPIVDDLLAASRLILEAAAHPGDHHIDNSTEC